MLFCALLINLCTNEKFVIVFFSSLKKWHILMNLLYLQLEVTGEKSAGSVQPSLMAIKA